MQRIFSGKMRQGTALLFTGLLAAVLVLSGCGSDSYDGPTVAGNAPVDGAATNVLIEPGTLKTWMDQGLVNNEDGFDQQVVIVDYGPYDTPVSDDETPRIKGACKVAKSALIQTRQDGLAPHTPLVATGEQMDAVIQNFGIDEDTIIVITSNKPYYATRAYWTFRYWGFSKDQIKLLNGFNDRFAAAYPDLMSLEGEEVAPSTFSVRDLGGVNTELRASMGELLGIIKDLDSPDSNDVVIDARGDSYYLGNNSTSALIADGKVVVDGHPAGGQYLSWSELVNADNSFKTAAEIRDLFEAKGWAPGKKVTVYCTSAYSATPLFFALDAILDTPVQLHDGSWSQTGLYSDFAAAGGQLPAGSPWAIDDYLEDETYNAFIVDPLTIESLLNYDAIEEADAPFVGDVPADDSDVNPAANDIEEADAAAVGATPTVTFTEPVATATANALVDAGTLQAWMDAGLLDVAPGSGSERVVLLDAATADSYAAGHIPGAQFWDISQHVETRLEGPAAAVNMVVTPDRMNTLLQDHGIDENTTIVITSSLTHTFFPSRAYFLFRYYGWPQDQLKVLNGYNGAWTPDALTTAEPAVTASTLTVQDIGNLRPELRVSLPELMDAVRDGRGTAVDFRGDKTATGSTAGVFGEGGDYTVFEGRPVGGTFFPWTQFNYDYAGGDLRFKSAAEIKAALNSAGIFKSEGPIYSYCRTGYIASTGFFVLDGILGWDVMTYDGSWSQWGKLSTDTAKGGELTNPDWAVDNLTYMEILNYNVDNTVDVAPLNADESLLGTDPGAPEVNQVEGEDTTYQEQASGNEDDGASGPPSPVDSPAIGC